jgi:hypothetical protein
MPADTEAKASKSAVQYQDGMAASHCGPLDKWPRGSCAHFKAPAACEVVAGAIERDGWCIRWKRWRREAA